MKKIHRYTATTKREEFVVLPFPLRLLPWSPPPQPVARARSAGNNEKIKQLLTTLLPWATPAMCDLKGWLGILNAQHMTDKSNLLHPSLQCCATSKLALKWLDLFPNIFPAKIWFSELNPYFHVLCHIFMIFWMRDVCTLSSLLKDRVANYFWVYFPTGSQ